VKGALDPRIFGIRLSMLFRLYGWRLRRHTGQELLAGTGIAIGVALIFGVMLANTSILSSAEALASSIAGRARLQISARTEGGFPEALSERAAKLPGVAIAAPLLHQNVELQGPRGRREVRMVGVTPSIVQMGGMATQNLGAGASLIAGGIGLPDSVAESIGARPNHPVTLFAGGRAHQVLVRAVLGTSTIGAVADSAVAVALLPVAQELLGREGRISELLIAPRPGAAPTLQRRLRALAGPGLFVGSAEQEVSLLRATSHPSEQATTMFAALGGMVGFLLTFSAMLLTAPERRRYVADLRMQGYDWRQVLLVLGFEAAVLGLIASTLGVGLGLVISHAFFEHVPVYLAFAFPIGGEEVVKAGTVLAAIGAGLLATLLASAQPALDLLPGRPRGAASNRVAGAEQGLSRRTEGALGLLSVGLIAVVTVIVLASPSLTLLGGVLLAIATFALIPPVFRLSSHLIGRAGENMRGSAHVLAVRELRATPMRSVALAGVAALAVYGSVAIGGARADLMRGLDKATVEFFSSAPVWVTTGMNDLTTTSFHSGEAVSRIEAVKGVTSVRVYQGGLLDVGERRLWIRARPPNDPIVLQRSQLIEGSYARASALIRRGGYAAVSQGFAGERHLHLGERFALPTPSGLATLRVAAITTNVGWPPGAITINTNDYRRYWRSSEPAALEVSLEPGVSAQGGAIAVRHALAGMPALQVQSVAQRDAQFEANARQGLRSLSQISTLLLVAAALAVAAALSASIWQRRPRLASLKLQGFDRRQLWRALLTESAFVLGIGCVVGALLGEYGHALAGRELRLTTGFPAPFALGGLQVLITLALVAGIAMLVIAVPGLLAARVPARASFQE
jgi:putative ABC transport system permease protein